MQVPFEFEFQNGHTFASFFVGNNDEIVTQLEGMAQDGPEQQIYLWGEEGCGKSHLLQACCQHAQTLGKLPFYLKLDAQQLPDVQILNGLEDYELVCLDDIHTVAGNQKWEEGLFGFYNAHRQNNHHLLLAANTPPQYLTFELPDLKTRMSWGLTLKIQPLREEQLIEAMTRKAHNLGFDLPVTVGRFLLRHYVQDLPAMWQLLEKIDRATLAEKRKLTIPFLKQILKE